MVLREVMDAHPGWDVSLLATDINAEMLQRTDAGTYSQLEVNRGLPIAQLMKHFDKQGTQWQVKQHLRDLVSTRLLNLAAPFPPGLGTFDVVFLRNVLIYFDPEVKRQVLDQVRTVLRPDGWLFLGGSETTLTIDDSWERIALGASTAYRPGKERA
jgi:chemotaxis protein methyltransferase CheR